MLSRSFTAWSCVLFSPLVTSQNLAQAWNSIPLRLLLQILGPQNNVLFVKRSVRHPYKVKKKKKEPFPLNYVRQYTRCLGIRALGNQLPSLMLFGSVPCLCRSMGLDAPFPFRAAKEDHRRMRGRES